MSAAQEHYMEAVQALALHEKKHSPIRDQYDRSYRELERLNRAVADAWNRLKNGADGQPK